MFKTRSCSDLSADSFSLSSSSPISRLRSDLLDSVRKETSDSSSSRISNSNGLFFLADVGLYSIITGFNWRASNNDPLERAGSMFVSGTFCLCDLKCSSWILIPSSRSSSELKVGMHDLISVLFLILPVISETSSGMSFLTGLVWSISCSVRRSLKQLEISSLIDPRTTLSSSMYLTATGSVSRYAKLYLLASRSVSHSGSSRPTVDSSSGSDSSLASTVPISSGSRASIESKHFCALITVSLFSATALRLVKAASSTRNSCRKTWISLIAASRAWRLAPALYTGLSVKSATFTSKSIVGSNQISGAPLELVLSYMMDPFGSATSVGFSFSVNVANISSLKPVPILQMASYSPVSVFQLRDRLEGSYKLSCPLRVLIMSPSQASFTDWSKNLVITSKSEESNFSENLNLPGITFRLSYMYSRRSLRDILISDSPLYNRMSNANRQT
ncbi:hypothetical protein OGAPHI_005622 [Ogataea philodendri]|uniref:Uncharacterized protein n=1 Tax=Ogataea philodendri TaxID=1378263 RepID=A0A9P8NZ40_9ASCO|nr:uncharacterized protein OGAPHI_005622 [Ogataea philodendri]KAH3662370.1 hypothetical protein OGAPHI_005622 [Ogataea philodendri]